MDIKKRLFELKDEKYREFQLPLFPTVDPETMIGVRTPELRKLAKELAKENDIDQFLNELPHQYYEEMMLHGLIIEQYKEYSTLIEALNKWLPYVDNWGVCDMASPKTFKKRPEGLIKQIYTWIDSSQPYIKRFGIGMLMRCYLGEDFKTEYADKVAEQRSEEYYVNMMIAWYFATALAKNYDEVLPYIEQKRLDRWTHNKTIQKAVESFRITDEQKKYLKTLKIKKSK